MQSSILQQNIYLFIHENERLVKQGLTRRHLVVNALAGSGKSTTLREVIRILTKSYARSVAYCMFNRETVEDFKRKNDAEPLRCQINTAHGYGWAAFRRKFARTQLVKDKLVFHYRRLFLLPFDKAERTKESEAELARNELLEPYVRRLTTMAKDSGIGLNGTSIDDTAAFYALIDHHELLSDLPKGINQDSASNVVVEMAQALLKSSNEDTDTADFSDMIYLTLLYNAQLEQFDYVLIDEAQDTNLTRRLLYMKMKKPWGCLVVVGDKWQAIYGFNGADVQSMAAFKTELQAAELPLSICYRCDKAIIVEAQRIVPDIEWGPAARAGLVYGMDYDNFLKEARSMALCEEDSILCRMNAPNLGLAFNLIRLGVPCRIEGRDIGFSLIKLAEKLAPTPVSCDELQERLDRYCNAQYERHMNAGRSGKAASVMDRCMCLHFVIQRAKQLADSSSTVVKVCKEMFQDSNSESARRDLLTLSSVHKAKGREWDRVFLLGYDSLFPSPFASLEWEHQQEQNLIYVATTRARHTLVKINKIPK